jgi:hypothetical protein
VAAYLFWAMTARVRRLEARAVVEEAFADIKEAREAVVERDLAEQPAFRSWLLFCRRDDRSIAPASTEGNGPATVSTIEETENPRRVVDGIGIGLRQSREMEEVFCETDAEAMRQEINRALGTGRIKHHPAGDAGADWLRRLNCSADAFNPRRQLRSEWQIPGPVGHVGPFAAASIMSGLCQQSTLH